MMLNLWASLVAQLVKKPPAMQEIPVRFLRSWFDLPGLGRSAGEGKGYPCYYSWTLLVAQLVKDQLAMRETWVRSLGWEDPLEKGKATHSSVLATDSIVHGVAKSWTRPSHFHFSLSIFEDLLYRIESVQFSSVAQLCPTLCYPMNGSTPGLPVSITNSQSLIKLMSIESVIPSNHLI